jgi:hypothetical protein
MSRPVTGLKGRGQHKFAVVIGQNACGASHFRDGPKYEPLNSTTANAKTHQHRYDPDASPDHRIILPGNKKMKL